MTVKLKILSLNINNKLGKQEQRCISGGVSAVNSHSTYNNGGSTSVNFSHLTAGDSNLDVNQFVAPGQTVPIMYNAGDAVVNSVIGNAEVTCTGTLQACGFTPV